MSKNTDVLSDELFQLSEGISGYIARDEIIDDICNNRTFYGETYAALLLLIHGVEKGYVERLLGNYETHDRSSEDFHWEFNNYALLEISQTFGDQVDLKKPRRIQTSMFKKVTNWVLLRSLFNIKSGRSTLHSNLTNRLYMSLNKLDGFYTDNRLDQVFIKHRYISYQYHIFCLALIAETVQYVSPYWKKYYIDQFFKGVDTLLNEMEDSELINFGRGRYQLFGYSTLTYVLSMAYKISGEMRYVTKLDRVVSYIYKFKNDDGSLPILLINTKNPDMYLHDYNNYYDYLPFAGYYFYLAFKNLS